MGEGMSGTWSPERQKGAMEGKGFDAATGTRRRIVWIISC